ncbi:MAG: hypothetical protein ACOVLK_01970 [Terrimicrobiaceae bacterium]|jgi:hypothetical protein
MARSKKPFLQKQKLLLAGAALLVVVGGAAFLGLAPSRQFSGLAAFPVEGYLEGNGLFSQEDFLINGTVENVLLRSGGGNRFLVSIRPGDTGQLLPVLVESGKKPIQREQRLVMKVHVAANGGIVCTDYDIR